MSAEYDQYLKRHQEGVNQGYQWLKEYLPNLLITPVGGIEHQIIFEHDASKNDEDEYNAYDAYFYGGNRSYTVVLNFRRAWLRHIHHNPHH